MTKLTDPEVAAIRVLWETGKVTQVALAQQFQVSHQLICLIVNGKLHVNSRGRNRPPKGRIDEYGRDCSRCDTYKLWHEFSVNPLIAMTGHQSACKQCRNKRRSELKQDPFMPRERAQKKEVVQPDRRLMSNEDLLRYERSQYLQWTHGISLGQYEWLEQAQGGKCALCEEAGVIRKRRDRPSATLAVDHDHSCKQHGPRRSCMLCIRGLLCDDCNTGLGHFEKKASMALLFVDYLERRPFVAEGGG